MPRSGSLRLVMAIGLGERNLFGVEADGTMGGEEHVDPWTQASIEEPFAEGVEALSNILEVGQFPSPPVLAAVLKRNLWILPHPPRQERVEGFNGCGMTMAGGEPLGGSIVEEVEERNILVGELNRHAVNPGLPCDPVQLKRHDLLQTVHRAGRRPDDVHESPGESSNLLAEEVGQRHKGDIRQFDERLEIPDGLGPPLPVWTGEGCARLTWKIEARLKEGKVEGVVDQDVSKSVSPASEEADDGVEQRPHRLASPGEGGNESTVLIVGDGPDLAGDEFRGGGVFLPGSEVVQFSGTPGNGVAKREDLCWFQIQAGVIDGRGSQDIVPKGLPDRLAIPIGSRGQEVAIEVGPALGRRNYDHFVRDHPSALVRQCPDSLGQDGRRTAEDHHESHFSIRGPGQGDGQIGKALLFGERSRRGHRRNGYWT